MPPSLRFKELLAHWEGKSPLTVCSEISASHKSSKDQLLLDVILIYNFMLAYLHPTGVEVSKTESEYELSFLFSWSATITSYVGYTVSLSGTPTFKQTHPEQDPIFQWAPGSVSLLNLFNFIVLGQVGNKDTLKCVVSNLSSESNTPSSRVSNALLAALPDALPLGLFVASGHVSGPIGGLYRDSLEIALQIYQYISHNVENYISYYNDFNVGGDFLNLTTLGVAPHPELDESFISSMSFIIGMLANSSKAHLYRVDSTSLLELQPQAFVRIESIYEVPYLAVCVERLVKSIEASVPDLDIEAWENLTRGMLFNGLFDSKSPLGAALLFATSNYANRPVVNSFKTVFSY